MVWGWPYVGVLFFFFLMRREPPISTLDRSSAASDVYKRQAMSSGKVHGMIAKGCMCCGKVVRGHNGGSAGRNMRADGSNCGVAKRKYPAPVSYTHLRAHETVLDLVCRLLLEKKKNYLCNSNPGIANSDHTNHETSSLL